MLTTYIKVQYNSDGKLKSKHFFCYFSHVFLGSRNLQNKTNILILLFHGHVESVFILSVALLNFVGHPWISHFNFFGWCMACLCIGKECFSTSLPHWGHKIYSALWTGRWSVYFFLVGKPLTQMPQRISLQKKVGIKKEQWHRLNKPISL